MHRVATLKRSTAENLRCDWKLTTIVTGLKAK